MASQPLLPSPAAPSSNYSSAHGCLETLWAGCECGEQKESSSVLMDSLGFQDGAGLQPWFMLLVPLDGLYGVKSLGERLGSPIFSTGLLKRKLLL